MSGSTATRQQYTAANNYSDRMILLKTGVPMQTKIGKYGPFTAGQLASIRLRNVGVITGLTLRFTANVTITGTVAASPLGPYAAVQKHSTVDYNTTERVFCTGPFLYAVNSFRNPMGAPWSPTGQGNVDTLQTSQPITGTGVNMIWTADVPFAIDPSSDLSGAVLAQTVVGEMYYRAQFQNNFVGDVFCPYTTASGGTVTVNSIYIEVWQRYIQPQSSNLPRIDLNTVYELAGMFNSNNNIVTNGTAYFDYPNVRTVLGSYYTFVDNAALTANGTDINAITLVANGNTNMRESDPLNTRLAMRNQLGGDLPSNVFYLPSRMNPIQTWIYSQVQAKFDFLTVTSSPPPYMQYGYESLYALNTPLPGIAASS